MARISRQRFTDNELATIAQLAAYHAAATDGYADTARQDKHRHLTSIADKAGAYRLQMPEGFPDTTDE